MDRNSARKAWQAQRNERIELAASRRSMKAVERWLLIGNMAKVVGYKPLTGMEKDVILLVFCEGRGGKYSATGRHTLFGWLAQRLDADRDNVGNAVRSLVSRGYAERGTNSNGAEYLWLTGGIFGDADRVEQRWRFKERAGALWPEVVAYGITKAEELLWDDHPDAMVDEGRAMSKAFDAVLLDICRANQDRSRRNKVDRIEKGGSVWLPGNVRELGEYRKRAAAKAV